MLTCAILEAPRDESPKARQAEVKKMNEIERNEEMTNGELIKKLSSDLTRYQLAYDKLAETLGASAELLKKLKEEYKLE